MSALGVGVDVGVDVDMENVDVDMENEVRRSAYAKRDRPYRRPR
jgi:hypothetical protein